MRRIITAREQYEMLSPWLVEAGPRKAPLDEDWMIKNILAHYAQVTPDQKERGRNWYSSAREWANNIAAATNRDPNRAYATIAALSPNTDWDANLLQGAYFLTNYDPTLGTDPKGFLPTIGANVRRAIAVHNATTPEEMHALFDAEGDPKISNFYRNFTGDENAVTIDRWMTRVLMGENGSLADLDKGARALGGLGHYDAMANSVRRAAQLINEKTGEQITPAQLQAMLWLRARPDDTTPQYASPLSTPIPDLMHEERYDPAKAEPTYIKPKVVDPMRKQFTHDVGDYFTSVAPEPEAAKATKKYVHEEFPQVLKGMGEHEWDPETENRRKPPTYRSAPGYHSPSRVPFAASRRATVGEEAFDYIKKHPGGITFKHHPGDAPQHGFMVSLPHAEKKQDFATMTPQDIDDYYQAHPEIVNDPANDYGGWYDPPSWVHDVSQNVLESEDAKRRAVDWKQDAAFDLDIPLKKNGEPLDQATVYTVPWVNSGPASALGWTQAKRRMR